MMALDNELLRSKEPMVTAVGLLALKPLLKERGIDWRQSVEEVGLDPDAHRRRRLHDPVYDRPPAAREPGAALGQ